MIISSELKRAKRTANLPRSPKNQLEQHRSAPADWWSRVWWTLRAIVWTLRAIVWTVMPIVPRRVDDHGRGWRL
eukprot:502592-Prorocentrum_minimum.AAC.2